MRAINTRASAGSPSLSLFKVLLAVDVRVVNKIVKPYGLRIAKATWAKNCKGNAHPPWIRTQKLDKLEMQIHSHGHQQEPSNPSHDQPHASIFIDGFGHCMPQWRHDNIRQNSGQRRKSS